MIMKTSVKLVSLGLAFSSLVFSGCSKEENGNGTVQLQITDAPIDASNVSGVYLTITGIEYHLNGKWQTYHEFQGPVKLNLLDLQSGKVASLGDFASQAGKYDQVRFMLDIVDEKDSDPANPACYISFLDGSIKPLKVPSGQETGYKAKGKFTVPMNGSVTITADFDVRKAVVHTGSGKYILKPAIRLVVNDQAGRIKGQLTNTTSSSAIVVHAYESGSYKDDETTSGEHGFANAVTSAKVKGTSGEYTLAFLAAGKYDLVVVGTDDQGNFTKVLGTVKSVSVESGKATKLDISTAALQ
jgi:hypothetical protein